MMPYLTLELFQVYLLIITHRLYSKTPIQYARIVILLLYLQTQIRRSLLIRKKY